jgi:uncharacterized GH25 family protein
VGEELPVELVWSHGERAGLPVDAARLEAALVATPSDSLRPQGPKAVAKKGLKVELSEVGVHQLLVATKEEFETTIADPAGKHGHRQGVKTDFPGQKIVSAVRGRRIAKALVVAGRAEAPPPPLGVLLEIVPLDAPPDWRQGRELRFRVLRDGKPVVGAQVQAGPLAEEEPDADREWPVSAVADKEGVAKLTLPTAGVWTLRVAREVPAEAKDRPRFDVDRTTATLSLEIHPPRAGSSPAQESPPHAG